MPPLADLPSAQGGATPPWLPQYVALMRQCWEQEPEARPTFDAIVAELVAISSEMQLEGPGAGAPPIPPAAGGAGTPAASVMCCICMEKPPNAALVHRADRM